MPVRGMGKFTGELGGFGVSGLEGGGGGCVSLKKSRRIHGLWGPLDQGLS